MADNYDDTRKCITSFLTDARFNAEERRILRMCDGFVDGYMRRIGALEAAFERHLRDANEYMSEQAEKDRARDQMLASTNLLVEKFGRQIDRLYVSISVVGAVFTIIFASLGGIQIMLSIMEALRK